MLEKLLENWLDSASERTYQPIFVQMLAMQNYQVLHSTRHCSLEFGKDVIAIDQNGITCAFQLKGKPGGRLGLKEYKNDIQPQLIQLISQPVIYPGISTKKQHRSFLVCNGNYDEEVQRAVDDLNRSDNYISKLELISRGQLLTWASKLGDNLWPGELINIRNLLELYLVDGHNCLPIEKLASILEEIFALDNQRISFSQPEFKRAVSSAALLVGLSTMNFSECKNHYASITAWCIHYVSVIGAAEKYNLNIDKGVKQSLDLAEKTIMDYLTELWLEIKENKYLIEGDAMAEPEVYKWRYTLICGLLAILWFYPSTTADDDTRKSEVRDWLQRKHEHLQLWGEGAIPSWLALLYFLRRNDPTNTPDLLLATLMVAVVNNNQYGSATALADPYYDFEQILRHICKLPVSGQTDDLDDDNFSGEAYTAELLMQLVATSLLKEACQQAWPNFTRLHHKQFIPSSRWNYCIWKSKSGKNRNHDYPFTYTWEQLRQDALLETCEYLPDSLLEKPHLLLLWTIIAPHRLTTSIAKILSSKLPKS